MVQAQDQVRVLMRSRRHNMVGQPDDFELTTNDTFLQIWHQLTGLFALLIFGMAMISLVVGGVVIMNIMLVSVTNAPARLASEKPLAQSKKMCACNF